MGKIKPGAPIKVSVFQLWVKQTYNHSLFGDVKELYLHYQKNGPTIKANCYSDLLKGSLRVVLIKSRPEKPCGALIAEKIKIFIFCHLNKSNQRD